LQCLRHLVERFGEGGQLVAAGGLGNAGGVAAGGDLAGRLRQGLDGAGDAPCQNQGHQQRGGHRNAHTGPQGDQHGPGQALVEVPAHLRWDGAQRHAHVGVEHPGGDSEGHHRQGQGAGHHHQHLRQQQLGAQAGSQPPAQRAHLAGPMR
jgi:hypothetical protein